MWGIGGLSQAMGNKIPYLVVSHPISYTCSIYSYISIYVNLNQLTIKTQSDGARGVWDTMPLFPSTIWKPSIWEIFIWEIRLMTIKKPAWNSDYSTTPWIRFFFSLSISLHLYILQAFISDLMALDYCPCRDQSYNHMILSLVSFISSAIK